jgi:hypothetical protein
MVFKYYQRNSAAINLRYEHKRGNDANKEYIMKIDQNGKYLPFAGVTVISPVVQEDTTFWSELHTLVSNPVLVKYFTPLPYKSYHMTTNNLCVQASYDDWHEFIDRNLSFFEALSNELLNNVFEPTVAITGLTTDGAIQLTVNFNPSDQEDHVLTIARKYKCIDGVPFQFHITLAYQYKPISHKDILAFNTAIQAIQEKTNRQQLILNPPKLHNFNDMTHYTPWDGTSNPFQLYEENTQTCSF